MAIKNFLGGLVVVAAATIGLSLASPAAAAPTNCQSAGGTTVCGQGTLTGPSVSTNSAPATTGSNGASGCTTMYGTYQRC
jgi:hypothetical protein